MEKGGQLILAFPNEGTRFIELSQVQFDALSLLHHGPPTWNAIVFKIAFLSYLPLVFILASHMPVEN